MKKSFFIIIFLFTGIVSNAQYETPGTGVNWSLDDLVANSGGAVTIETPGQYKINQDITISDNDTFTILTAEEINVMDGVLITINGTFISQPESGIVFFKAFTNYYLGFRFDDSDDSQLTNTYFKKAGGIKLVSSDVTFSGCDFTGFNQEYSTGTINLFESSPVIEGCSITLNDGPAVMSSANGSSSPQIFDCEILFNVASNSNTPQINLGTSGGDSIRIVNCEIIGNRADTLAGGIAITTLIGGSLKARIQGNVITDNRYGITAYGNNVGSVIRGNEIRDNNTQNLPMLGGSGINFQGDATNVSVLAGNIITGNLWGITIVGEAIPNFGQLESEDYNPGVNQIFNNGNEGVVYDLYNNTPNPIMAQNNYWGTMNPDTVEMHIFHQPDNPALGFVDYLPLYNPPVGIADNHKSPDLLILSVFPNPATNHFYLEINPVLFLDFNFFNIEVWDVTGQKLNHIDVSIEAGLLHVYLPAVSSGFVFVKVNHHSCNQTLKVLVR